MKSQFKKIGGEPVATIKTVTNKVHGETIIDDYNWIRADNWQEAMREPELLPQDIKSYLNNENAYYEKAMADTGDLQKELVAEMRGRIKEVDNSLPTKDGPYAYITKYIEGGEHPIHTRTPRDGGEEEILLDVNKEAKGHDYFEIGAGDISPDHNIFAWSRDTSGSEYYALTFRDLKTGKDIKTSKGGDYQIADVGSAVFGNNETLFYSRVDENHRPSKVFRHTLGTDPKDDILVYEEKDPRFYAGVGMTRSEKYIVISVGMNDQSEYHVIPADDLTAEPKLIEKRTEGLEYEIEHQGDRFLILTNADDAVDFKIVEAPIDSPSRENWKDVVPHKQGRMIISIDAYQDWVIWMERENALPRICFMDGAGVINSISFKEEAYALGVSPSPEFDKDMFRFSYSSPTTPTQTYDYDLKTNQRTLLKEQEIPSGHDASDYITRRVLAKSHDGAQVPVTLLHHKDTPIDGTAPCLLYGYGSYGMSMPASFSTGRLSLVDRGFIYAIAHVRGGEEKGRFWYEDAKFGKKPNTFHDFIAAGKKLIEDNYTAKGNIVIQGGSAGGLLVGATVNMAPDLFAGVIGDVPFVDVLNTILDDTLPLTPGEWSQWGNPIESEQAFKDIKSYCPYTNVEAKSYPPMLVTAGVSDPRVTYWEPAKWVAKLRATKTDDNILMLRTNMTSGHFGKSGRFAALEDAARSYAFALKATGKI
ncbi:MAG: S9 family peptidase [Rhizobiales bacterium]|nr:S9 family peptidase [Hyphomicrobiales bacterium]